MIDVGALDFDKGGGLLGVVAQRASDGAVLMFAFANREAVERTLATGELHFFSRRRGLWKKGETSGNTMRVVELRADCDGDTLLARVEPRGPACHSGQTTCFGAPALDPVAALDATIESRATVEPAEGERASYTRRLLEDRNLRLKKLGEEASELVVALADGDRSRAAEEAADVVYHLLVGLRAAGLGWDDVKRVLGERAAQRNK